MIVYPRIIAHRCGGVLAPENTLAGLAAAARLGCRAVEFDVMLTADHVPILMHDETLDRTTRCTGRVAEMSFADMRARDETVPTLEEALAECWRRALWVNIELKPAAGYEQITGQVVGRWLARHWNGHGLISSFSEKSTLALRHEIPAADCALLFDVLPGDWQARCDRVGATAVHLDAAQVDDAVAAQLGGFRWACYTVNETAEAERLFASGCAAIFTDHPALWFKDSGLPG